MFRIAIIDDESLFREYLRTVIDWKEYDFEILFEAKDGSEAYQKILEYRPDIIFTDINMPNTDGLELIRLAKKAMPNLISVIITGYSEFEYARTALKLGVEDFLLKPFDKEELENVIFSIKSRLQERGEKKYPLEEDELLWKFLFLSMENGYVYLEKEDMEKIYHYCKSLLTSIDAPNQKKELHYYMDRVCCLLEQNDIDGFKRELSDFYEKLMHWDVEERHQYAALVHILLESFRFIWKRGKRIQEVLGDDFHLYTQKNIRIENVYFNLVLTYKKVMHYFSENKNKSLKALAGMVREYIDMNYFLEDLSTGKIAKDLFSDDSYIRKAFKAEYHCTITEYINRKRMEEAREILKQKKYKVAEISTMVGYTDSNYFHRMFKKHYGISPKEYSINQNA